MCMGCSRLRVERKRVIARHGYKGLADRAYEDAMLDLEDQWNALTCRLVDQDYWREFHEMRDRGRDLGGCPRRYFASQQGVIKDIQVKQLLGFLQRLVSISPADVLATIDMPTLGRAWHGLIASSYGTSPAVSSTLLLADPKDTSRALTATDILTARDAWQKADDTSFIYAWRADFHSMVSGGFTARFNQVTNGVLLEEEKRVQLCAGDKFGEFEGHRAWLFDLRTGLLKSCWQDQYVWHPAAVFSANEEVDDFGPHGIHGFKSEDDIERYASAFQNDVVVFGRVRLWGDVIEHDRGYRAEFARIVSLDRIRFPRAVPEAMVSLAVLRQFYNVEEPNGN